MRESISALSPYEMAETLSKAMQTFQKQTNADHIRAMSDEELKDFLVHIMTCTACREMHGGKCPKPNGYGYRMTKCGDMILDWLRQEADNGPLH